MKTDACIKALEDIAKIKLRAAEGAVTAIVGVDLAAGRDRTDFVISETGATKVVIKAGNSMGKTDMGGVKFDDGKPDYTLVPWDIVGYGVEDAQLILPFYRWWRGSISASECTAQVLMAYYERASLDFVDLLAQSLNYGATKYAPWNWEKGISRHRLYAAACRHFKDIYDFGAGAKDAESGLYHTAHLAFYAVAIHKAID